MSNSKLTVGNTLGCKIQNSKSQNSIAISVKHLTKIYKLYDKPIDRLKESLHPLKKS
ncbi:MAG: hypothetical protein Q8R86_00075 [Sulfuricurvum sp.]|nr:hypothetical protein [Sulfuricurvum sp.]